MRYLRKEKVQCFIHLLLDYDERLVYCVKSPFTLIVIPGLT